MDFVIGDDDKNQERGMAADSTRQSQCVRNGCGYPQIDTAGTGKRLRYLSRKKNISVQEIQHCLGLASNQAVYEWFNGKSLPTLNNFFALSRLFHTPMEEMLILREKTPYPEEKHMESRH